MSLEFLFKKNNNFLNSIRGTFKILSQSGDRGPGLPIKEISLGHNFWVLQHCME